MKKTVLILLHVIIATLMVLFIIGFNILTLGKIEFNIIYWIISFIGLVISIFILYFMIFFCAKKEKMLYDRQESKKISIKKYIIISAIVSLIIDLGLLLPRFIKYIPYNEYGIISITIYIFITFIIFIENKL